MQRHVFRREGRSALALTKGLPIATAIGVQHDADDGTPEFYFTRLDRAAQERRHRQPYRHRFGFEERLAGTCVTIGNPHLLETEVGRGQQLEVHSTADAHVAAEKARGFLLEDAAIGVPVDDLWNSEQRRDHHNDERREPDQKIVHRLKTSPTHRRQRSHTTSSPVRTPPEPRRTVTGKRAPLHAYDTLSIEF